ncbi:MAG: hypothetical protein C4560_05215 [Nitrospiraceae bacterium]|nr:MAG: hypothetical protein C4560_05215 [Nitrospiraceae bacterium]
MTFRSIFSIFIPPTIPKYTEKDEEELLNKAVRKHTSGNILLQFGRYLLTSDISKLKEKALKHKN